MQCTNLRVCMQKEREVTWTRVFLKVFAKLLQSSNKLGQIVLMPPLPWISFCFWHSRTMQVLFWLNRQPFHWHALPWFHYTVLWCCCTAYQELLAPQLKMDGKDWMVKIAKGIHANKTISPLWKDIHRPVRFTSSIRSKFKYLILLRGRLFDVKCTSSARPATTSVNWKQFKNSRSITYNGVEDDPSRKKLVNSLKSSYKRQKIVCARPD